MELITKRFFNAVSNFGSIHLGRYDNMCAKSMRTGPNAPNVKIMNVFYTATKHDSFAYLCWIQMFGDRLHQNVY